METRDRQASSWTMAVRAHVQLPVGVNVMDGPFMTLIPIGKRGKFLPCHVQHAMVTRAVEEQMPQGPRVLLAHRDRTDAQPSIVVMPELGCTGVFTDKIDHCAWVDDEIAGHVVALPCGAALA